MAYLATGQPILILKEGTQRSRGREARRRNIAVAVVVAEALKTALGPRGMDKMLIDSLGDVTVTNDGATVLEEMELEHPIGKMIKEAAKTQEDMVGDGTTTATILTGELLRKAQELLDDDIHPTIIVSGYRKAAEKALELLDEIAMEVDPEDRELLKKVALTSMSSKALGGAAEHLAEIAIDAVKQIVEKRGERNYVDKDNIQIVKKEGRSLRETELIKGVVLEKEVVHPAMPKRVEDAKIALVNAPMEIEKTEFDAQIRIRSPEAIKAFLDQETEMLRKMVMRVKEAGANVLFCQKGIDDIAQYLLAKEGILAVRRVKESDMEKLARATGAEVVTSFEDLRPEDLGWAALVEERKIGEDKMVFVEGCKDPKSVAVLIRGGLERVVDEAERAMDDAISVVADVIQKPKVVPGGGAVEVELARRLKSYAVKVGGREQWAIEAFADALEVIPKTLAENAGHDVIDTMVALRAAHEKEDGFKMGIDVYTGEIVDMVEKGVLDPAWVKEQAIKTATELASMVLRIDDVIAAVREKEEEEEKGPEEKEEESEEF
ncbi:TCP-1/cpn60 chaperonin family protein [Candidatus Bathyarchaeota archaeon]|nr:TCP-1/cpn60 chaperonin family protein [Candidatus Bathyarchaeota archaeon]